MEDKLSEFLSRHEEELRIVIVGRPGTGKSSSGDTILGRERFKTDIQICGATAHCYQGVALVDVALGGLVGAALGGLVDRQHISVKSRAVADRQHISVTDTPGQLIGDQYGRLIDECVRLSAPGPHVFLVVSRLDRFTEEDIQVMQGMKERFGPDVDRYCMVLFTGGDQLEDTMEELLDRSPGHRDLVYQCYGQYHVFNNKLKDQSQVSELLHKIRNMVQENGGRHYTIRKFQAVTRKMKEEKRPSQAEKEEERGGQRDESSCNII